MAEIFGNDAGAMKEHNLTFRSQAERAVLPAKENMDLAFPPFPRKAQQHLELEKIWPGNVLEDNKHENSLCVFTGFFFTVLLSEQQ